MVIESMQCRSGFWQNLLFGFLCAALALTSGSASLADDDELKKLLTSYERHVNKLAEPSRDRLSKDLQKLEDYFLDAGILEPVLELREARAAYFLKKPERFEDDRFSLNVTKFSKEHAGGKKLQSVWNSYQGQLSNALYPARQKLLNELKKLETSLTKSDQLRAAIRVKAYRKDFEAFLRWPTIAARIPKNATELDGNFYLRYDQKVNFDTAKEKCAELKGHLVTISSKEENKLVKALARKKGCWLGANNVNPEAEWRWITGEPFDYKGWGSGEPNGGRGHHLFYSPGLDAWNDIPGGTKCRFICEWARPRPDPFPEE